jgi:hypothetical protein
MGIAPYYFSITQTHINLRQFQRDNVRTNSRVGRNKITQAKLKVSVSGKVGRVVPETSITHFRSNSLIPTYRAADKREEIA